ncbi:undecaprenyl diphosphate synthase family protein [Staphylococcus pseudintermedius]
MFKKFMKKMTLKNHIEALDLHNIPEHIAIIMDGNGRWAKQRKMPRIKGHYQGMQTIKTITRVASDLGVRVFDPLCFFNGELVATG